MSCLSLRREADESARHEAKVPPNGGCLAHFDGSVLEYAMESVGRGRVSRRARKRLPRFKHRCAPSAAGSPARMPVVRATHPRLALSNAKSLSGPRARTASRELVRGCAPPPRNPPA
eukprot:CAMPEP_0176248032 /NCGR_PEP_ID=MMETSP0121_2-20121125/33259_1 /TAXON_ID=160619 /ORGANISM="Kryptoperidinium foliaceum, Strain CCMP 1326" /LENGTH=116 /DNA_ID=CAMNT_0017587701 /DNA_START=174 /DNA_END=521 /DNA_ORIENTATION=+